MSEIALAGQAEVAGSERIHVKIAKRLFPFVLLGYLFSFLDRVNVGFAALQMNKELGFTASVFGFGASLFFVSYVAFQIPSTLAMQRVGARVWLGRILITWGIASALTAFAAGPYSFYGIRLVLGAAEAGWVPGLFLYLSFWFPASFRARSQILFLVGAPLALAIGSPLSGWIMTQMNGVFGLEGWRWLFITEGAPSILLGLIWFALAVDGPAKANWLSADEKATLQAELDADQKHTNARVHTSLTRALMEPCLLVLCLIHFLWTLGFDAFVIWMPQIIQGLGDLTPFRIGLITAIPSIFGVISMILWARHSDRTNERTWHTVCGLLLGGTALALSALVSTPVASVAMLTIAAIGIYSFAGSYWPIIGNVLDKKATGGGFALVVSVGNIGGFVGPYFIGIMRDAFGDFRYAVIGLACSLVLAAIIVTVASRIFVFEHRTEKQ